MKRCQFYVLSQFDSITGQFCKTGNEHISIKRTHVWIMPTHMTRIFLYMVNLWLNSLHLSWMYHHNVYCVLRGSLIRCFIKSYVICLFVQKEYFLCVMPKQFFLHIKMGIFKLHHDWVPFQVTYYQGGIDKFTLYFRIFIVSA